MLEHAAYSNITDVLKEKLDEVQLRVVKEIGMNIATTGMSIKDCCLLARITTKMLDDWIKKVPELQIYIDIQRTEYKRKLLKVLTDHAVDAKDVKVAISLLETSFPAEYNTAIQREAYKNQRPHEHQEQSLQAALNFVRQNAKSAPIADKTKDTFDRPISKKDTINDILV